MNTEIERRFLVKPEHLPHILRTGGTTLSQGYLSLDPVVRVRASETEAWITVKSRTTGISKQEYEYPIPVSDAWSMLELCQNKLTKTRRTLRLGNHVWEVDEFHDNLSGLWIAEIELSNPDEVFEIPNWIDKEVSSDARYFNSSLCSTERP
jgi:CYTH domain-containing protein